MNRNFCTDGLQTPEKMLNITNHQGNASQNYSELPHHTYKNGNYQKRQETSVGEDMAKRESLLVGSYIGGKQYGVSSKN